MRQKPGIGSCFIGAFSMNDGIVLIRNEQRLAASCRSHHQDRVINRPWSRAIFHQFGFGEARRMSGDRACLLADHSSNLARTDLFNEKPADHPWQLRPSRSQFGNGACAIDRIPKCQCVRGTQLQQVTCGNGANHAPGGIRDTQVPDPPAIHSPDGAIDESICRYCLEWPVPNLASRLCKTCTALFADQTNDVPLGDNCDILGIVLLRGGDKDG